MALQALKMAALLLTVGLLAPSCLALPAKLDQLQLAASQNRNRNLLQSGLGAPGYNYDAPAVPSGLYELPGPPPAPIIPTRPPTTPTTTTTTTTTTIPPPPSGLYGAPNPDREGGPSNLNPNFISLPVPLDVPEPPPSTRAPVTLSTPKGFSPPPAMMNKGDMPYMPYDIAWGIDDREGGNVYSHSETSGGNDVQGEYRVLLPDGRMQVVSFWADPESGYNARVNYV